MHGLPHIHCAVNSGKLIISSSLASDGHLQGLLRTVMVVLHVVQYSISRNRGSITVCSFHTINGGGCLYVLGTLILNDHMHALTFSSLLHTCSIAVPC